MSSAHLATLSVTGASYSTAIGTSSLSIYPANQLLSFLPYGSADVTLTISDLPNYVAKGDLSINFTLVATGGGGTSLGGGIAAEAFLTEAAPTGIQSTVWRDVLEDACAWAIGQAGVSDCQWWTTFYLFHAMVFVYDPANMYYTVYPSDVDDEVTLDYRLRKLFHDRAESGWVNGDCQDVSNYLCIVFMSLGISAYPLKHRSDVGPFMTNLLCGIGDDSTVAGNYEEFPFNFHQTTFSASTISDATCAQWRDLSGSVYQNPPSGWSVAGYWQTPWSGASSGESDFLGLTNRYPWSSNPEGEPVERSSTPMSLRGYTDC